MEKSFSVGVILADLDHDKRVTQLSSHKRLVLLKSELEKKNMRQHIADQIDVRPAWVLVSPDGTCDVFKSHTDAWKYNKRLIDMGHIYEYK